MTPKGGPGTEDRAGDAKLKKKNVWWNLLLQEAEVIEKKPKEKAKQLAKVKKIPQMLKNYPTFRSFIEVSLKTIRVI